MYTPDKAGKIIGVLFLIQMVAGIYVNFSLLQPLNCEPSFLIEGAANSAKFGVIALLALVSSSINLIVASIAYRIFSGHNPLLAMLAVFFPCISLALTAVEYSHIMELVSYSQHYQAASVEAKVVLETFRPVITSSRSWSHFMAIGFSGFSLFLFYLMLFRTSQTPRLLMGFGLLATIMQVSAVAQPFFGNNIPFIMLLPLALSQLVLPVYFIAKGLDIRVDIGNKTITVN
ncbi:MAG: DUF4386 domain-containing protein [Haliea sp.]